MYGYFCTQLYYELASLEGHAWLFVTWGETGNEATVKQ